MCCASIMQGSANDHWTVHGDDAIMVARDYYKSMGVIKVYGSAENPLDGCSISKMMFQSIVRNLLLVKKYVWGWGTETNPFIIREACVHARVRVKCKNVCK